ncbi:hypothetical protein [Allosphingosinicella sp.]|uniref:hypothetical protein n=1 Tax=Allosphingosinicella sp. TaxID=2823234 RepID=UPI002EFFCCB6
MTLFWTAGIVAATAGAESEAPAADPAVVDRFITELSQAEAEGDGAKPARIEAAPDVKPRISDKIAKDAGGRIDRAEPMVGAVLTLAK